jgi:acylphosphatase
MVVEGLVQGVGFRWFVARHAQALGLHGYVANLYTGNVEIEAEGERSIVEQLIKEVKIGPRSGHVADLHVEWREPLPEGTKPLSNQFEIR